MADVLTPEELEALRKGDQPTAEETTTEAAVTPAGSEATPAPSEVIKALPGAPRDIETYTQKGDALKLTIARPTRPMAMMITRLLGYDSTNQGLFIYFRAIGWLTHVNGVKVGPFIKREDFEQIAELIGDEALETLAAEVFSDDIVSKLERDAVKK